MEFDHFAVSGETLEVAAAHVQAALGVGLAEGGRHEVFGTHNRLLGLADRFYLEAIATDPAAPPPGQPRWFALDEFQGPPRITNWICRVGNLDEALAGLPLGAGRPVEVTRGSLRWRMAVPDDGKLPFQGAFPALIEWLAGGHPAEMLPVSGCRMRRFTVAHPEADALLEMLGPHIADPRLRIELGPVCAFRAEFDTPSGRKVLQ